MAKGTEEEDDLIEGNMDFQINIVASIDGTQVQDSAIVAKLDERFDARIAVDRHILAHETLSAKRAFDIDL